MLKVYVCLVYIYRKSESVWNISTEFSTRV